MRTQLTVVLATLLFLTACESPSAWQMDEGMGSAELQGGAQGGGTKDSGPTPKNTKSGKAVYSNQGRNGPCWKTDDCRSGLICKAASKEEPGLCSADCEVDSDCGNGFLCRQGSCQTDCAGVGEKCTSDRRPCCFHDTDSDGVSDASCGGADPRCVLGEPIEVQ